MATDKRGVFCRFDGQRAADLDLIVAHLTGQTHGVCSFGRTDAVYAAVRMAAQIIRGDYVKANKNQRKYNRRIGRVRAADDGSTGAGGAPNPWPPGTVAIPSARGTDRAEWVELDAESDTGHANHGVPDEPEPE